MVGEGQPLFNGLSHLEEYEGNVSQIARSLGKDRKQIYRWLDRYGFKN